MNQAQQNNPVRYLTRLAWLALIAVALISVGRQVTGEVMAADHAAEVGVLRAAAAERSQSQRVARTALLLREAIRDGDAASTATLADALETEAERWGAGPLRLTGLKLIDAGETQRRRVAVLLSETGLNLERGVTAAREAATLARAAVSEGLDASAPAAETSTPTERQTADSTQSSPPGGLRLALDRVVQHTDAYLAAANTLMGLYEQEIARNARTRTLTRRVLTGAVLLVVVLAGVAVLRPAQRRLAALDAARRAQAEELQRLAEVAERTNNAVVLTDVHGRVTWVNAGFTRLTGYEPHEAIGHTPGSLLQFSGTDPETIAAMRRAVQAGGSFRGDVLNRGKNGREYWLDIDIQPRFDEHGNVAGFLAIQNDITPLVVAREHERAVFEAASHGIVELDAEGRIVESNPAAEDVLGLTRDELLGRTPQDPRWGIVAEDGTELKPEDLPAAVTLRTGEAIRNHVHGVRLPSGAPRWVSVSTRALRGVSGEISGVVACVTDITEQREAQHRAEMIIEGARLGTWDWRIDTGEVVFNNRWAHMLGYEPGEVEPHVRSWERLVHPDDMPGVMATLTDHLEGRTPIYCCEHRLLRKDGSWAWVLDAGRVIQRDDAGKPVRAGGIHLDITESKETEARLREAEARATRASAAKSEFLANMSHEIRTPMTAILGYAELIEDALAEAASAATPAPAQAAAGPDGRDNDGLLSYAATIRRNGEHLLEIINDILDISKIEAGRMTVERIAADPEGLLGEVESLMRVRAADKKLRLEVAQDGTLPPAVLTDPTRLRQILINLAGNAVKFTDSGAVSVRASYRRADGGRATAYRPAAPAASEPNHQQHARPEGWLRFEVRDTGPGMTPEQVGRLFEAFGQGDRSTTRRFGGTGLGLRITRALCELLGGTVQVRSEPGVGSAFTVQVPVAEAPDGSTETAPDQSAPADAKTTRPATDSPMPGLTPHREGPLAGLRVWLVEDSEDNRRLIGHHLRAAGAEVREFELAHACLDALWHHKHPGGGDDAEQPAGADRAAHACPCDLVLTDIQMPGMDGYGLARELRARGFKGPIVALTAHAMATDARRCFEAGCDSYATKPITREELIQTCLGKRRRDAAA